MKHEIGLLPTQEVTFFPGHHGQMNKNEKLICCRYGECTAFYSYQKMDLMAKIVSKVPFKKCTKNTGERLNIVAVQCCLHSKYHLVSKERPLGTFRLRFLTIISNIVMFSYQNTCGFLKLFHPSSCQMETFEWHDKRAT